MAHIQFKLIRTSDEKGNTRYARISKIESDMPPDTTNEVLYIMHALASMNKIQTSQYFTLNNSILNGEDYLA
jgi:hypothetical protein